MIKTIELFWKIKFLDYLIANCTRRLIIFMIQFKFPAENLLTNVEGIIQIRTCLEQDILLSGLSQYCSYRYQEIRGLYLYCKCRYCDAQLTYSRSNVSQSFKLVKSKISHHHKIRPTRKQIIIDAINTLPLSFDCKTVRQLIMPKFNVSPATFYRHFNEARFGKSSNFIQTWDSLKSLGFFGFYQQGSQQLPDIALLTTQSMKNKFQMYGACLSFDLTFNLVREKPGSETSQYTVGAMIGMNSALQIQPFCLVITSCQTKESFKIIFRKFFQLMEATPNTIITDEQKSISVALKQLRQNPDFSGIDHFLDSFHILRHTKRKLTNKQLFKHFVSMIHSRNEIQLQHLYEKCSQQVSKPDLRVLTQFIEKASQCCFGGIPPNFIGFGCSTSPSQKINDLIKSKMPYSQPYCRVIKRLALFFEGLSNRTMAPAMQRCSLQNFMQIPNLAQLRNILCKKVLHRLIDQFCRSATCLMNVLSEQKYLIQEQGYPEKFEVYFAQSDSKWRCHCLFSEKSGIPCSHIIKVLLYKKQDLIVAINKHWILQSLPKPLPIPHPKKTRRSNRY